MAAPGFPSTVVRLLPFLVTGLAAAAPAELLPPGIGGSWDGLGVPDSLVSTLDSTDDASEAVVVDGADASAGPSCSDSDARRDSQSKGVLVDSRSMRRVCWRRGSR